MPQRPLGKRWGFGRMRWAERATLPRGGMRRAASRGTGARTSQRIECAAEPASVVQLDHKDRESAVSRRSRAPALKALGDESCGFRKKEVWDQCDVHEFGDINSDASVPPGMFGRVCAILGVKNDEMP